MLGGVLAGLAAGFFWGIVFVAPYLAPNLSTIDLVGGRYMAYGAMAALVMLLRGRSRALPTWRQAGAALGLSVLGYSGYYLLLVLAVRDCGPELPTLIIGTIPLWVMLLGKPEHLLWRALVPGLLLTLAGLGLMTDFSQLSSMSANGAAWHYWRGIGYASAATLSWTTFAVFNAAWLKRHPEVSTTDWANWLGLASALGAWLLWMAVGTDTNVLLAQADRWRSAMVCIATGVGAGWIATILWNRASRVLSGSLCGQLIVSETLFGLLFAFAFNAQWPTATQALASVLFVLGILASIRAHR